MADDWIVYNLADRWLFWSPVVLIDGSKKSSGLVMRRKVDDVWQYRGPTLDEDVEYALNEVW